MPTRENETAWCWRWVVFWLWDPSFSSSSLVAEGFDLVGGEGMAGEDGVALAVGVGVGWVEGGGGGVAEAAFTVRATL